MKADRKSLFAKTLGGGAGLGALLAAGIHQGFGGPETAEVLARAQGQVPPALLVQIEAAWIAATASFLLLGVGLLMAAVSRPGWLYSLGRAAAAWFAAVAAAFLYSAPRWGEAGVSAQAWLLAFLAVLAGLAAWLASPRRA
jgi:hypothetical protein